jgi:hypothetical protein
MRPAPKNRTLIVVVWPYEAQEDNEIDRIEGGYIYDVEKLGDVWWRGTTADGRRALFPTSYVEECAAPEVPPLLLPVRAASNPVASGMEGSLQGQKKGSEKERGKSIFFRGVHEA